MEKRDGSPRALTGGCGPLGSWRRLSRSGASYVIAWGWLFGFLWWVLSWKQGQKLGKLSVMDRVLAIGADCYKASWIPTVEMAVSLPARTTYIKQVASWASYCR